MIITSLMHIGHWIKFDHHHLKWNSNDLNVENCNWICLSSKKCPHNQYLTNEINLTMIDKVNFEFKSLATNKKRIQSSKTCIRVGTQTEHPIIMIVNNNLLMVDNWWSWNDIWLVNDSMWHHYFHSFIYRIIQMWFYSLMMAVTWNFLSLSLSLFQPF